MRKLKGNRRLYSEFIVNVLAIDAVSQILRRLHGGIHDVEEDREDGAGGVNPQRHPPKQLLVQLLLKVLQDEEADGEAGQSAGQMGHVRNRRAHALGSVTRIYRIADVARCCNENTFENRTQIHVDSPP